MNHVMDFAASGASSLASQRVAGEGRLVVGREGGRSCLRELYQQGAARICLPQMPASDMAAPAEAILINTAGGMTGGDRLDWEIGVGAGASLSVTTQACEKVYRSAGGLARQRARLTIGAGGRLAWLPQETILFDRSAFRRELEVELGAGASILVLEAVLFGRVARGETVVRGLFRDRWRVRSEGRLVHAEETAIGPDIGAALAPAAATGGGLAVATLLLVAPDAEERLDAARAALDGPGGASCCRIGSTGKLLARLVAEDGYALRRRLVPLVGLLNGQAGLPNIWTI